MGWVSLTDPFIVLGLERAKATELDVKNAYAALLKVTRPEDDRAAFMALREAFTAARAIAKGNNSRRPTEAVPLEGVVSEPVSEQIRPVNWTYHEDIQWNVADTDFGEVVLDTLRWILGGGAEGDVFIRQLSERLTAFGNDDATRYRNELISFLVERTDTEHSIDHVQDWEVFEVRRPEWLNHQLMASLANDVRIFECKPTDSYSARNYNVVLNLFQSVLEESTQKGVVPVPIDAASMYADEQNAHRKDAHGSYFDRAEMVWKDQSPVGRAISDFEAAIKQSPTEAVVKVKATLDRDDLQVIDEHQNLDMRLRSMVCEATGWHGQDRRMVYPKWLTRDMLLLLDDAFGWSRHYGRHSWERQQFDWLHKVISRDRKIDTGARSFRRMSTARVEPYIAARKPPGGPSGFFSYLYLHPMWLLILYFGYRLLQVFVRTTV